MKGILTATFFGLCVTLFAQNKNSKSMDVIGMANTYGKDFPKYSSKLMHEFLSQLGIKKENLDTLVLKNVEDFILSMGDPIKYCKENFLGIIATLGSELISRNPGSNWEMIQEKNGFWHPCIKLGLYEHGAFLARLVENIYVNEELYEGFLTDEFNYIGGVDVRLESPE